MKTKIALWAAAFFAAPLFAVDWDTQVLWNSAIKDGYFTDAENWLNADAAPLNDGQMATWQVTEAGDYTIRFPQGTTTSSAAFYACINRSDATLTIDTTEGTWYQGPAHYPHDYFGCGFFKSSKTTTHFFNFESIKSDASAPICSFSGGQIEARSDGQKHYVSLLSGILNFYDPNGVVTGTSLILAGVNSVVTIKDGSIRGNAISQRAGDFVIEGGDIFINNSFSVGDAGENKNSSFKQTGGKLEVGGTIGLSYNNASEVKVELSGSAEWKQNADQNFYIGNTKGSTTLFDVKGDAKAAIGRLRMGSGFRGNENAEPLEATINIQDNAELTIAGGIIGENSLKKPVQLIVSDEAKVTSQNKSLYIGNVTGKGDVTVQGEATFTSLKKNDADELREGGTLTVKEEATYNCYNSTYVKGGAQLIVEDYAKLYMSTNRGEANTIALEDGGYVELNNNESYLSTVRLSGGTNTERENKFCIKKGTHTVVFDMANNNHQPILIGGGAYNSVFEVQGGKLTVPRLIVLGTGTVPEGFAGILRVSGGEIDVVSKDGISQESDINVADEEQSRARVELLRGKVRCRVLKGWNGSPSHNPSATGWAELYANGGAISPNKYTYDPLIKTFDKAVLGENGLIVDTEGLNIAVDQAFVDEVVDDASVNGLFTKTGTGTLTVKRDSTHSRTLVSQGDMYFEAPSFGRNLEVINGAAASTVGNASGITVDTLTLGSASSIGYLKVDQGDVITIRNEDGLNPINGIILCDNFNVQGTHDIFKVKLSESYDRKKLKNIKISGANKDYSYTFNLGEVGEDGYSKLSLTVAQRTNTPSTWLGNTSDWNVESNWSSEGLPDDYTIATFTSSAANKQVAIEENSVAYEAKVTGGDYIFEGGANLTLDKVTVDAGSLKITTPQTPNLGMKVDVSENATLDFSGSISSIGETDEILKIGVGSFILNAASPNWFGSWCLGGGKTIVKNDGVFGSEFENTYLKLNSGTLVFDNADEEANGIVNKKLVIDSANTIAIIDAKSPVTFNKGMETTSGALVKKGSSVAEIKFPAGEFTISKTNFNLGSNGAPTGDVSFNENGTSPEAFNKEFAGLTVAEGTLRISGEGASATTINQKHITLIGGTEKADLEISAAKYYLGGSGFHCFVGGGISANCCSTNSTLRVINNAYVDTDSISVAGQKYTGSAEDYPYGINHVVAITNATVSASWCVYLGNSTKGDMIAEVQIGENGILETRNTRSADSCIDMRGNIKGIVSNGGVIYCRGEDSRGFYFYEASARGELNFINGGILKVAKIAAAANATTPYPFTLKFNGGVFEIVGSDKVSFVNDCTKRTIEVGEKGMTINVKENSRHTIAMAVNGEGGIKKTGAGDLLFAKCFNNFASAEYTAPAETTLTLNTTGANSVEGGSLTLEAGTVREGLDFAVASGATLNIAGNQTLGAITGGGTVTSSALRSVLGGTWEESGSAKSTISCNIGCDMASEVTAADVPLFENIDLENVAVKFAPIAEDFNLSNNIKIPVARIGNNVTATPTSWRTSNRPPLVVVNYTVENGVVYANPRRECLIILIK